MNNVLFSPIELNQLESLIETACKNVIDKRFGKAPIKNQYDWFNLDELIAYDPQKRKKPTFYALVSQSKIPYHKKGKKLYFLKSEIDEWLKSGRKKTNTEIEVEANLYLVNNKKGSKDE